MDSNKNMPIYKFSSFTEDMVVDAFGLTQELDANEYIANWIENSTKQPITPLEEGRLKDLSHKLKLYLRNWNGQELRTKFIAQIIQMVDYDEYNLGISAFEGRELRVQYNNTILQGKVEWMVAKGVRAPKQPFFFIHEYKKEQDASNDPVGQLLITLCTAQLLNHQKPKPSLFNPTPSSFENIPLYGIYITGRFWFFVRLKENKYYISKAYSAEDIEDLAFILKMLKAQKQMIIDLLNESKS